MSWFWMNIPLALLFFGAWAGIPLWMVLRHPSWCHEPADGSGGVRAHHEPLRVPVEVEEEVSLEVLAGSPSARM